jgi:uncharacterized iron-regulated protein
MRHGPYLTGLITAAGLALCQTGCSSSKTTEPEPQAYDFSATLADFSEHVALATYLDMKTNGAALSAAAVDFAADPTNQSKLDAVASAWVSMREPWEASEAFLFGPAEFLSLDPALDSWPVDRQQLDAVLSSSLDLTPANIANGLGPALRGFHTVEYLVFRNGAPRAVNDVTQREREYLVAVASVLADDAAALHDEWAGGFAQEFAQAGQQGSRYAHESDAVLEIAEGMAGILDEVANGKIADPYDQQNPELVESQFSWNSLTDFANNIRSVRNAYQGGYHLGTDGVGLDQFVASKDPALDARLKAELQMAIDKIGDIPAPFRNNLNAAVEIEAAQAAIRTAFDTVEGDVKPLLTP